MQYWGKFLKITLKNYLHRINDQRAIYRNFPIGDLRNYYRHRNYSGSCSKIRWSTEWGCWTMPHVSRKSRLTKRENFLSIAGHYNSLGNFVAVFFRLINSANCRRDLGNCERECYRQSESRYYPDILQVYERQQRIHENYYCVCRENIFAVRRQLRTKRSGFKYILWRLISSTCWMMIRLNSKQRAPHQFGQFGGRHIGIDEKCGTGISSGINRKCGEYIFLKERLIKNIENQHRKISKQMVRRIITDKSIPPWKRDFLLTQIHKKKESFGKAKNSRIPKSTVEKHSKKTFSRNKLRRQ